MDLVNESYKQVYKKIEEINAQIESKTNEYDVLVKDGSANFAERIKNLEEALEKADDYLLRVRGFQELAKKNLESTNVLTIEAPPGYRVNLNRLRNWSMLIDPTSSNDPYAQRVFLVAKCDEFFLEQKKVEFAEKIENLKSSGEEQANAEAKRLEQEISLLKEELKNFELSEDFVKFSKDVVLENNKYWITNSPEKYPSDIPHEEFFAPGGVLMPLSFSDENKERIGSLFGKFFDESGNRILVPYKLAFNEDFVMTVSCAPSRSKQLDKGIQNILMNYILNTDLGTEKIYLIDAARYSSNVLGPLKNIEGTALINQIPRNPDQLTETLETIVSSFSDIDDVIELSDSIREYNSSAKEQKLPTTLLVLYGWPNSFSGKDKELVKRIMQNYERYGVSLITVSYTQNKEQKDLSATLPEYAANNAINIVMKTRQTLICENEKEPRNFAWYTFNEELNSNFVDEVKNIKFEKIKKGNEYTTWFSCEQKDLPSYTRDYKPLDLPFGMDAKEQIHSVSFENENFAAYLVGASRSGKSTLLHTLIAGIIRNYHPDNVELWLADFKQLEFKRYIDCLPPHIKYVLLDESEELVYDLIDRLTAEMMERQKLFAKMHKERIDQIDVKKLDKPLPVIFVILDEFSIMSQAVSESISYKLKLQNILAKGAALGIRFLFSSQSFSNGIGGLTPTARGQIQQRIAMKVKKEEISETLELSQNLKTEQVKNWMSALPPHYALIKHKVGEDVDSALVVQRLLVLYFQNYDVRDEMVRCIKDRMKKTDVYNPNDIDCYVDKHPVLVDGNTFNKYEEKQFETFVKNTKHDSDEFVFSFGTPRLMTNLKSVIVSNESRENLLLVARSSETDCATSIILSAIKQSILQGITVEVWVYSKNKLYVKYKDILQKMGCRICEDMSEICEGILYYKQNISERTQQNVMIVMIGMDRICSDFEYVDSPDGSLSAVNKSVDKKAIYDESKMTVFDLIREKLVDKSMELNLEGSLSAEEIEKKLDEYEAELLEEYDVGPNGNNDGNELVNNVAEEKNETTENVEEVSDEVEDYSYDASKDLTYIIKQGSRLGYHFMFCINNVLDLKQSGLKIDYFRHRMSFQTTPQESYDIFNKKIASALPERICQYDDGMETYSFRPYLHFGVEWDGWGISPDGKIINPYLFKEEI